MSNIKKAIFKVVALSTVLTMVISSASAFSEPYLSMNFNSYPQTLTVQIINTAYPESADAAAMCNHLEVGMYLYRAETMYGGVAEVLLDDGVVEGSSEDHNTDSSVSVFFSAYNYQMETNSYYVDEGYAYAEYATDPDFPYITDDYKMKYFNGSSFSDVSYATKYAINPCGSASLALGKDLAASFGNVPNDYQSYCNSEITEVIDFLDYLFIRRSLYLCSGDKVPTYFISPDGNVIIAVKQDKEGTKYSRTFEKNANGKWEATSDFLMIASDTAGSATRTPSKNNFNTDNIPSGYAYISKTDLCETLGSVEAYLIVRKTLGGGVIDTYYFSEDEMSLLAVTQDGQSKICSVEIT